MAICRIVTGNESLASGTSNLIVQVAANGRLVYISEATKQRAFAGLGVVGRPNVVSAATSGFSQQGRWFDTSYTIPDGTVLRVFARSNSRLGGRRGLAMPAAAAVVFLKVRAGAALRRLTMQTIEDELSSRVPVLIEGMFDFVSLREAGREGIPLKNEDMLYSKTANVQALFTSTILSPEKSKADRVEQISVPGDDGKTVNIKSTRKPRALDLGD